MSIDEGMLAAIQAIYDAALDETLWPSALQCLSDFTSSQAGGNLRIVFTDTSTGPPTEWSWNFGDGSTSARQNPRHVYDDGGDYQVTLTVTNAAGSSTKTETVTVANETGIPIPSGG